jgi:hypothetical protein
VRFLDRGGVDAGAVERRVQRDRAEIGRVNISQPPVPTAASRA